MLPAAVLAGGLATRLRPITEKIPKALVEIDGEPFLAHQLRLLAANNIRKATLCVGHLGANIREYAGDGSRFGIELTYSFDGPTLLGTAGALAQAVPLLGERFFVIYGDSYLPCDYAAVERAFLESGKLAQMTAFENDGQWDASNVEFEGGRILAYDKKHPTPRMRYIDFGLGAFHASAFRNVPQTHSSDLADLYSELLAEGQLAGFEVHQRFYEIGSFQGIEDLSRFLTEQERIDL
jgi:NDP-sugar pyrophosphorylase family protein